MRTHSICNTAHFVKRLVLVCLTIQFGNIAPQARAYDLSSDYSATSNPNGVWSYGAMANLVGAFTPCTIHQSSPGDNGVLVDVWSFGGTPEIWHNGTTNTVTGDGGQGVYPPGTVELTAGAVGGTYNFGVARFTAPQAGVYNLQTSVKNYLNGPSSSYSDFRVLDNGSQLYLAQILPSSTPPGPLYSYSNTLNLAAGETIDFVVGRGLNATGNFAAVNIQASLTLVPEPASIAILGLGTAAMLIIRRRK